MFQELTQGSAFCYDSDGQYLVSNTGYILSGADLKYLTACLNSKVIEFCFKRFYSTSMGKTGMRWLYQYVINLPIPRLNIRVKVGDIEQFLSTAFHFTPEETSWINENS